MKNNFINQLTWFNISLKVSPKEVLEHYFPNAKIEAGNEFTFFSETEKHLIKGVLIEGRNNQLLFKRFDPEKKLILGFVELISQKEGISYLDALKEIKADFNLQLEPLDASIINSQQEDYNYAMKNGLLEKSFSPSTEIPEQKGMGNFYLNGIELCGTGGISVIIGQPGAGKSNLSEIICSKFYDSSLEGLGFEFRLMEDTAKILYIDAERRDDHLYKGWLRLKIRCQNEEANVDEKVIFQGYRNIVNRHVLSSRLYRLEYDIALHKPSVLIIDGVAKFVDDINNLTECNMFKRWLLNIAEEYKLTVVVTIHANPSDMKAHGHLGSEFMRDAESVLAIKYDRSKGNAQRLLTTDFPYGKVRGDSDKVESCFEWSEEKNGFVSCTKSTKVNSEEVIRELLEKIFEEKEMLSYKELGVEMSKTTGRSYDTERRKIANMVEMGFIEKRDSMYYLIPSGEPE